MEVKIFFFFFQFGLICLSIPWFFEPRMDYEDTSKLISAHAKQLDSMLKVPQNSVSVKNINENYELGREGKASVENDHFHIPSFNERLGRVETETQKSSNGVGKANRKTDNYVEPRLSRQSFNLRPFENLGRNFGFQIPSSTFSKTNSMISIKNLHILFNVYFSFGPKRQQPTVPGCSLQVLRG